jgi:spore germination protein
MIKYRVKPGDTLWKIARRFGITVEDIIEANPGLTDSCPGFEGVINIPV